MYAPALPSASGYALQTVGKAMVFHMACTAVIFSSYFVVKPTHMKNSSRQIRSSPQASGVKLPKNASKPPPSRLCSHLDSQFSHNAPPLTVMRPRVESQKTMSNGEWPLHSSNPPAMGFYHGPPRDPSLGTPWLASPNMATTLQPLEPCRSFELRKGTKKKNGHAPNCNFLAVKVAVPLLKRPSRLFFVKKSNHDGMIDDDR